MKTVVSIKKTLGNLDEKMNEVEFGATKVSLLSNPFVGRVFVVEHNGVRYQRGSIAGAASLIMSLKD